MSPRGGLSRRELLMRAFRQRDTGLATTGADEAEIRPDLAAPETAPVVPDWEGNLERVLESLNDSSGIEEP